MTGWRRSASWLCGVAAATILPTVVDPAPASAAQVGSFEHCGSVLLHRYDWLGGYGVAVHPNAAGCPDGAVDHVNGVAAGFRWQCVELINRLYLKNGWITSSWLGNGNQMFADAPTYLRKDLQGSITGTVVLRQRVGPPQQIFLSAASRRIPNGATRL